MDHVRILNEIRSRETLEQAFNYAVFDRTHSDFYFDYFEIEYMTINRELVLDEIVQELRSPEDFTPRLGYAYFPPKTGLCYRRMVYLPFKDLVIRYAFCIVLAKYLNGAMSPASFANRRASSKDEGFSLLQDFSRVSWPRFCEWQRKQAGSNTVLAKTDISAYYDSISHRYLIDAIAKQLSLDADSGVIKLFRKLLTVDVVSYSQQTGKVQRDRIHQGLPIGNNTEGFLANIYLNHVDSVMSELGESSHVFFGRYNDDMRIFGRDRATVLVAVRLLQELLLVKGLNLNAGKTRLAEDEEEIEDLLSKNYELYEYAEIEDEDGSELSVGPPPVSDVKTQLDLHFYEFDKTFVPGQPLKDDADAKDFCKFLSARRADGTPLVKLSARLPEHIETLGKVLTIWQGSGKHAAWLVVQSAFYRGVPEETRTRARELMFAVLQTEGVNPYVKCRLLHHLVKPRGSGSSTQFRFLDHLTVSERGELEALIPSFLSQPAFELNIVAMYVCRLLGASLEELGAVIRTNARDPAADPILNALSYVPLESVVAEEADTSSADEPDDIQPPY